jgi:hypothetical protein
MSFDGLELHGMSQPPREMEMTKKAPQPGQPSEASHHWRGGGVEPGTIVDETAEQAASRAEGNAPLPVAVATKSDAPAAEAEAGAAESKEARDDEAENEEEKRQAAAEEHAAQPVKHAPHGRL